MSDSLSVLLGDLQYVRSELARNEEVGEKRFGFFVTLVTAVTGGLFALEKGKDGAAAAAAAATAGVAPSGAPAAAWTTGTMAVALGICAMLAFGLATYVRLWHRNSVTDGLKLMTKEIRNRAIELCPELDAEADKLSWPKNRGVAKWVRAGYAEVVGVIDGVLTGAFLFVVVGASTELAAGAGLAVAAILWIAALDRQKT